MKTENELIRELLDKANDKVVTEILKQKKI